MQIHRSSDILGCIRFAGAGAWLEFAAAYRRSRLGTLWRSIGLIVLIALVGVLFGAIFKGSLRDVSAYILHFAVGVVIWDFISSTLNQSCAAFSTYVPSLRHSAQPVPAVALRVCLRNLLLLAQTVVAGILVYAAIFGAMPPISLQVLPALVLVVSTTYALAGICLLASIRFRDLPQFVAWLMNISFFLTPIIWPDYFLGRYLYLRDLNPFYHLVELFRAPMTGSSPSDLTWICGLGLAVAAGVIAVVTYRRFADRIAYWL